MVNQSQDNTRLSAHDTLTQINSMVEQIVTFNELGHGQAYDSFISDLSESYTRLELDQYMKLLRDKQSVVVLAKIQQELNRGLSMKIK